MATVESERVRKILPSQEFLWPRDKAKRMQIWDIIAFNNALIAWFELGMSAASAHNDFSCYEASAEKQ